MAQLGFTFYPKDWWTSDTFFELGADERYIYLECMFLMYQNDGYLKLSMDQVSVRLRTQIKPNTWEKITQRLTQTDTGYTLDSIKKRRSKADVSRKNGKKGGRKPKPKNPTNNPPLEEKEKENIKVIEIEEKEDVFLTIDINFENYLKNKTLCSAMLDNKKNGIKNSDHLQKRLESFNETLKETGVHSKNWHDYTSHFRHWNLKTKDLKQSKQSKSEAEAEIEALIHKNPNRK